MKPRVLCACCQRPGRLEGRGLIKACYERRRRDGTLRLYAPTRRLPASSARLEALDRAGVEAEEREAQADYEALRKLTCRARARLIAAQARARLLRADAPGRAA